MDEMLMFAVILSPIVLAMVQLFKVTAPINKNIIPLMSLAVGLFIGFAASPFTDLDVVLRLWAGGIAGLSATGLFELGSKSVDYVKEEIE